MGIQARLTAGLIAAAEESDADMLEWSNGQFMAPLDAVIGAACNVHRATIERNERADDEESHVWVVAMHNGLKPVHVLDPFPA